MTAERKNPPIHAHPVLQLALLWCIGWTLRVTVLAVPPMATDIRDYFMLGDAGVGALTMLPLVAIAFGAIPAAWSIHRFGVKRTIAGGIAVMALASAARGYSPNSALLFSFSIAMGLGIAAFQTALPSAAKEWTPKHAALGSAVYLNGMMVGEFTGAGLTLPLVLPLSGGSWQFALLLWSVPVLIIATWTLASKQPKTRREVAPWKPHWKDGQMWQFGILLAGSIVVFYAINAYAAVTFEKRGETQILPAFLLTFNLTPLLASALMLKFSKWVGHRFPLALSAFVAALGLAGFVFLAGPLSWALAIVAGFAATIQLILLVSLPSKIADGLGVSRLSAGMTLVGYGLAFLVPLGGGWLASMANLPEIALWPAVAFAFGTLLLLGRAKEYRCSSIPL